MGSDGTKNKKFGTCALCHRFKKYVDAHIIPRAFFEYMRPSNKKNEPFEIITNTKGVRNSVSRIGIYDNHLICLECERGFQSCDDYGQDILLKRVSGEGLIDSHGKIFGYQIDDINYDKLKMFFLSVMWRASVSSMTPRLRLGERYEGILRNIITRGDLMEDVFDCVLARHEDYLGRMYLLDPVSKIRFSNSPINFAMVYLGAGYKLYVKVDKRPLETGDPMHPLVFRKGGPLYVIRCKDFLKSKEYKVLETMI